MTDRETIEVILPAGVCKAEEERLTQAAINRKIDDDIDDVLAGLGDAFQ